MSAIENRKRSIGIAALMVLGLMAGFLVATTAAGEAYATIGTVAEDNQAYTIPLEEDQRIRFTLDAAEDAANAEARFAVYDPQDRFFGAFTLEGDEDDVELLADQEGHWVVFVTDTLDAELAVQFAEDDRGENTSAEAVMDEIKVTNSERTIAKQDGGALDEQLALRLDKRPATAFLEFEGDIADLAATVTSDEGTVYEIQDAQANVTEDGTVHRSGQTDAMPGNLVAGPYQIEATAESFSGTLTFVSQSYDRGARAPSQTPEAPEQPNPLEDASIVATAEEDEAYKVPMQGANELLLAVKGDASAEVFIYNSTDALVDIVELDGKTYQSSYDEDDEEPENGSDASPPAPPEPPERPEDNDSRDRVPIEVVRLNATDTEHVVYVKQASGREDTVLIALPDASAAEEATQLDLEAQEITFEHAGNSSQTQQANLTGGLVGMSLHSQDVAAFERTLSVTGPLGNIATINQRASTFGFSLYQDHHVEEENFSAGLMELHFQQESLIGQGETTIELVHYVR